MKDYGDNNYIELEKLLKTQADSVELESAEETLAAIRPKLIKKQNFPRQYKFATRLIAVATCLILIFVAGLTVYLSWPNDDSSLPPEYRYEDADIEVKTIDGSDLKTNQELFIPNLDILADTIYKKGRHLETFETVYYIVSGINMDNANGIFRAITLLIVLQEKYEVKKEDLYNSDNTIIVSNTEISYFYEDYVEPFYNYKIGFKIGAIRYYIDYQTTSSENDIELFMQLFLH